MTDTTLEEARRCPSCQEPGRLLNRRPAGRNFPRGTQVELYECQSNRCPDYLPPKRLANGDIMREERIRYAAQVNPDGTVPPKGTLLGQPKNYIEPSVHSDAAQRARDVLRLQAEQDLPDGGQAHEIRRDLGW